MDLLTSTFKLKRNIAKEAFAVVIEALYGEKGEIPKIAPV